MPYIAVIKCNYFAGMLGYHSWFLYDHVLVNLEMKMKECELLKGFLVFAEQIFPRTSTSLDPTLPHSASSFIMSHDYSLQHEELPLLQYR